MKIISLRDVTPSEEDVKMTDKLNRICKLMEIPLIEHIIIGDGKYFSFNQQKMLKNPDLKLESDINKIDLQPPKRRTR